MDAAAALRDHPWRNEVTDDEVRSWWQAFQRASLTDLQRHEVLHYLTAQHVREGVVTWGEADYLVLHYQPLPLTAQTLQTPEETFGQKKVTRPCPKCHGVDTTHFVVQLRSADEPSSVLFSCYTCQHQWKYR